MIKTGAFDKLGKGIKIAEKQREKRKHEGFLADLFNGNFSMETFFPWPEQSLADRENQAIVMQELREFLLTKVDPHLFEATEEIPLSLIEEMSKCGFFALKIPKNLGGKGLSQVSYSRTMGLAASYSAAIIIILSADNTIGLKYPILLYGTLEQKAKYLPKLSLWPSGFCFTEKYVGSDPARMSTYALRIRNEKGEIIGYRITGEKWYTTNSALADNVPFAKYLAVVARIVDRPEEVEESECFGIFIVPTDASGVTLGPRNEFCGMRGIYNANPKFDNVSVSKDQLIGEKREDWEKEYGWGEREGSGFRIALEALNFGRILIAVGCLASAKQAYHASNWYASKREQWGKPIGLHEAIGSGMLAPAAATIFAMEAMTFYTSALADVKKDARLAASCLKVFASEHAWTIIDNMMQIFGGRGYEKFESLSRREKTVPVERIWRDTRPNRIFEGSTQILSQWTLREGLAEFIDTVSVLEEKGQYFKKVQAVLKTAVEYLTLLPSRPVAKTNDFYPLLRKHIHFLERVTRKFARSRIIYSGKYRGKLKHKQLTMERFFWIVTDIFAMSASIAYAHHLFHNPDPGTDPNEYIELANMFCGDTRLRIENRFLELRKNNDVSRRIVGEKSIKGKYQFLRKGIIPCVSDTDNPFVTK